jgi:hypothetical protein
MICTGKRQKKFNGDHKGDESSLLCLMSKGDEYESSFTSLRGNWEQKQNPYGNQKPVQPNQECESLLSSMAVHYDDSVRTEERIGTMVV